MAQRTGDGDLSADGSRWSRAHHILALNLYFKIPFGKFHARNPDVARLATVLRRRPGAVAMKLGNFAHLDPALRARGVRGLPNVAAGVRTLWHEFQSAPAQLVIESERLLAARAAGLGDTASIVRAEDDAAAQHDSPLAEGEERDQLIRARVNQGVFRRMVLAAFEGRCCVTGLAMPEVLVASHIVPWAEDRRERLNPRNGLCLNALHDQAFDRRLMYVDVDDGLRVRFTDAARKKASEARYDGDAGRDPGWMLAFDGQRITEPTKFGLDHDLLRRHAKSCIGA